ncbi:MAG: dihydrofolate reductase [Chitinophagales bacterium]|nr:dihydrofolate reductase [Chitinophagales bacterium]MDW8273633.1 dihydrofolate reductase [Chitinophagales bacterium]
MKISLVAAIGKNRELGAKGKLLWSLPDDMKRFRQITTGHHVLMGRKTFESIPPNFRPLKNRTNIVLTRNPNFTAQGCFIVSSLGEAIALASGNGEQELMVIGGGEIYKQALPLATTLYLTIVEQEFPEADTFFPAWNTSNYSIIEQEYHPSDSSHAYAFTFLTLIKINSAISG